MWLKWVFNFKTMIKAYRIQNVCLYLYYNIIDRYDGYCAVFNLILCVFFQRGLALWYRSLKSPGLYYRRFEIWVGINIDAYISVYRRNFMSARLRRGRFIRHSSGNGVFKNK